MSALPLKADIAGRLARFGFTSHTMWRCLARTRQTIHTLELIREKSGLPFGLIRGGHLCSGNHATCLAAVRAIVNFAVNRWRKKLIGEASDTSAMSCVQTLRESRSGLRPSKTPAPPL